MNIMLHVKKSKIPGAGKGLFASKNIPKGKILGHYKGRIINQRERSKLKDDNYVWVLSGSWDGYYIDGKHDRGNLLKYVNGAILNKQKKMVNVEHFQKGNKIYYKTTKNIKRNCELVIDYGNDFLLDILPKKTRIQKAVCSGLEWVMEFIDSPKFKKEAANVLLCLQSMKCLTKNKILKEVLETLIITCLEDILDDMDYIFEKSRDEMYFMFYYLNKNNAPKELYMKYYRYFNKAKDVIYEGDKEFEKTKQNFDKLSDECIYHMSVEILRKNQNNKFPKVKLPTLRFLDYWNAIKSLGLDLKNDDQDLDYHVTHIVYIYNCYFFCNNIVSKTKDNIRFMSLVRKYIKNNTKRILRLKTDVDMIGEWLDCLYFFGINVSSQKKLLNKLLSNQKKDGSFGKKSRGDGTYEEFHRTWVPLNSLSRMF